MYRPEKKWQNCFFKKEILKILFICSIIDLQPPECYKIRSYGGEFSVKKVYFQKRIPIVDYILFDMIGYRFLSLTLITFQSNSCAHDFLHLYAFLFVIETLTSNPSFSMKNYFSYKKLFLRIFFMRRWPIFVESLTRKLYFFTLLWNQ